jgi:hypothetical protein
LVFVRGKFYPDSRVSARATTRAEALTAAVKAKKRPKSREAGRLVTNRPGTVV